MDQSSAKAIAIAVAIARSYLIKKISTTRYHLDHC